MNFFTASIMISIFSQLLAIQTTPLPKSTATHHSSNELRKLASFVINTNVRISPNLNDLRSQKGINTETKEKLVRISLERHKDLFDKVNRKYNDFIMSQV